MSLPQTVLITGAASGIGQALAISLAPRVKRLILWGLTETGLQETAKQCVGAECTVRRVDVSEEGSVEAAFEKLEKEAMLPDFIFHAAGVLHTGDLDTLAIGDCRKDVLVNYMGTVHVLVHAGRRLPRGARIICVSSVSGLKGFQEFPGYCASKFAVLGFCEAIYYDLKKKGIDLSVICPPAIDTPMVRNLPARPILYDIFPFAGKEQVIQSIIGAIDARDRFLILVDLQSKFLRLLNGVAPETTAAVFDKIIGWKRKKKSAAPSKQQGTAS